MLINIKKM